MRYLICLVVGALAGVIVAGMFTSAMQRRNAWPRALMNVMQHELGAARSAARDGACTVPAQARSAAHLRLVAGDLEGALLAAGTKDRVLSQYITDFGKAVTAWDAAAACPRQAEALTTIANACEACHRDYR
ncbi:hypothetical protein [Dokdonella fugitiva]|jgi:hypothetical protein|uniref:hypothetical protein n=1 Tax=Dokdonella fugitiva TaxID=328517 RepID=UPI0015FD88E2|nr:hypothetical protein [Dokdonella fugitiva]MBA8883182.1 hypothetical protein [Dokdonella fugitiva]